MLRSTRIRRWLESLVFIPIPLRRGGDGGRKVPRSPTASSPRVQIGSAKVELAAQAILLGRDRSLRGQLPKRVAMDTQVLSRMPAVEPFVVRRLVVGQSFEYHRGDLVCEVIYELIEESARGIADSVHRRCARSAECASETDRRWVYGDIVLEGRASQELALA